MKGAALRVTLALAGVAAAFGLYAGWRIATLEASDLVAEAGRDWAVSGGDPAACSAVPGTVAWIEVVCGTGAEGRLYQFDRLGRVATSPLADAADAAGSGA